MLFSVHHHFMASLGSNNFVLSLKVWIQKTDATSDKKIGNACVPYLRFYYFPMQHVDVADS